MAKFLGAPLDIPQATADTHAVRRSYVDAATTSLGSRVTTLEGAALTTVSKSAAWTAVPSQLVLADATSGAFTVTLPAAPPTNTIVAVKKVDSSANIVTVVGSGGTTIDLDANATLGILGVGATFIFDGTNWRISSTISFDTATSFTYRGTYSAAASYYPNDVVQLNGSSYVNLTASTGTSPSAGVSTSTWGLMSLAGTNGTNGTNGAGVVAGGTIGQVLSKKTTATDYDTQWVWPTTPTVDYINNVTTVVATPAVGMRIITTATAASGPNPTWLVTPNQEWVYTTSGWVPVPGTSVVLAIQMTAQTGLTDAVYVGVTYQTLNMSNPFGMWAAAQPSRFVAPWTGVYQFTGGVGYATSGSQHWTGWRVDGSGSYSIGTLVQGLTAVNVPNRTWTWRLTAGQYVEQMASCTAGSTWATSVSQGVAPNVGITYLGVGTAVGTS